MVPYSFQEKQPTQRPNVACHDDSRGGEEIQKHFYAALRRACLHTPAAPEHPDSVLFCPGETLSHTLHQRLLVVDPVERRCHTHWVTKKEPLVQGLAPAKGAVS